MACQRFSDLPSASAVLTGTEIMPLTNGSNVDQKTTPGAIAISATAYDAVLTYTEGYEVLAADGNIYRALQNAVGQTPQTSPAFWKLAVVQDATTLAVPSVHSTIIAAMTYLEGAIIQAPVVIQVANGAYNYTTTQINLAHPYGRLISITGNIVTPASCSLSFAALPSPPTTPYLNSDSGSIYSSSPSMATINGFSVLKSGGAPVFGHCGILASNGATINVGANMIVNGFYANLAALNDGVILASAAVALVTVSGAYAIYADNGTVQAPTAAVTGPGHAIGTRRSGVVRANGITVSATNATFVNMASGLVEVPSANVGNVDTFYDVDGVANFVIDTGATFGSASLADISLGGTLNYNGAFVAANNQDLSLAQIEADAIQTIAGPNQTVFLDEAIPGLNTAGVDLSLSAGDLTGLVIDTSMGWATVPVALRIGATDQILGIASGVSALDAAGVVVIPATWLVGVAFVSAFGTTATLTGPLYNGLGDQTPGVSVTIRSAAGAADSGEQIHWFIMDQA